LIFPIKYDINTTQTKDGKSIPIKIPGNEVLLKMGALLQVTVTHPHITAQNYINRGEQVPKCVVHATIDTGASISIITPQIASQLNLFILVMSKLHQFRINKIAQYFMAQLFFPGIK